MLTPTGPCLAHTADLLSVRPDSRITTLLRTRLATLGWLLDEAGRKRDWRRRHEPQGTEMSGWAQAPTWLTAGACRVGW